MKLIAHVQIEITDDGRVRLNSLGYTLAERSRGPVTLSELQTFADKFEAEYAEVPEPPQELKLEAQARPLNGTQFSNDSRPSAPPDRNPRSADAAHALTRIGFTIEEARSLVTLHGVQRSTAIAVWVERRGKEGNVSNAKALAQACFHKKH